MNKLLIICDRSMYGGLLGMVFFLPYSFALIGICQGIMILAWIGKRFLLHKTFSRQHCSQGFNFLSSGMGWSLIAIAVLIVVTIPFSHDPALSLKKFFSRFLQQIFLMYAVTEIIHTRKRLYTVLAVLLLTLFGVIIDVTTQYMLGKSIVHHTPLTYGRVSGPMNHPNDLGTLLVTVLPVVLTLAITSRTWVPSLLGSFKSSKERVSWTGIIGTSVLFLLLAVALGLSDSRGAWVAFVVSTIALGVLLKSRKLVMVLIFSVLVVFLWIFGMHCLSTRTDMYSGPLPNNPVISPTLLNPFGLPPGYNAMELFFGPSGRTFYWETAVNVIKHYPWFGCGYSAYGQTLKDLHVGHEEWPHNSLLQITAELGFLGLILYGWFFTSLCLKIKNVLRTVSRERDLFLLGCGLSSGMLAWMIHGLLDTPWASLQLSVLWWLFIGILLSLAGIGREETAGGGIK